MDFYRAAVKAVTVSGQLRGQEELAEEKRSGGERKGHDGVTSITATLLSL